MQLERSFYPDYKLGRRLFLYRTFCRHVLCIRYAHGKLRFDRLSHHPNEIYSGPVARTVSKYKLWVPKNNLLAECKWAF
jgi:hypothetical protein